MESTQLTLKEPQPVTLAEYKAQTDLTVERATYWAKSLMKVVEQCGLAKNMSGKKYLEVEGWQMIAEFAHVKPIIEWVRPWLDNELNLIGYEARCKLVNENGEEIGAGESSCGMDAFPVRGKQGSEKDKAAKSAAQTWAISRALRNKFSFVAKIAGYEPVPAEEMHFGQPESAAAPEAKQPESGSLSTTFATSTISEAQAKRLFAIAKSQNINEAALRAKMKSINPLWVSTRQITRDAYDKLCEWAREGGKPDPFDDIPDFEVPHD